MEIGRALELLDRFLAPGVEFLFEAPDGAAIPVVVIAVAVLLGFLDLLFGGVHQPGGEFGDEVYILHQVTAGHGERVEVGEALVLGGEFGRARLLPVLGDAGSPLIQGLGNRPRPHRPAP